MADLVKSTLLNPFDQWTFTEKLRRWESLCSACYGPKGKHIVVQNALAGHVSVTSTSVRLLQLIKTSDPLIKLFLASMKQHCQNYKDFGLFSTILGLNILRNSSVTSMTLNPHLLDYINKTIIDHISVGCSFCKVKLDLQNINHLLRTVKSILRTKSASLLSQKDIEYISPLLLKAFLYCVPPSMEIQITPKIGTINYLCLEGCSVINSQFVEGVLCSPHLCSSFWESVGGSVIALYSTSLAGDCSEALGAEYYSETVSVDETLIKQLLLIGSELVKSKVKVVVCQKVAHPRLAEYLNENKIMVFDRLGKKTFQLLHTMTGGTCIGSLTEKLKSKYFGMVAISSIKVQNQTFINFKGSNATVGTVVLCQPFEECLAELEVACEQVQGSLIQLLSKPEVFVGAGCLESHLAFILFENVANDFSHKNSQIKKFDQSQMNTACENFVNKMFNLAKLIHRSQELSVDLKSGHIWSHKLEECDKSPLTCACGLLTSSEGSMRSLDKVVMLNPYQEHVSDKRNILEPSITDVAVSKLSAYKTAFEVCSLLPRIGICIVENL